MAKRTDAFPLVDAPSRDAWRAWLEAHHAHAPGAWLVFRKKASGAPSVTYDEAVEEALCFGWIDSVPNALDDRRFKLLMTPRKPRSPWSRLNKTRVAALVAAGRMAPAGRAKIDAARADGSWTVYDAAESLEDPPDLLDALRAVPGALDAWRGFAPSSRKGILWWIISARTDATRGKRCRETARLAAMGLRANFPESRGR